jgi:hypothetical protein
VPSAEQLLYEAIQKENFGQPQMQTGEIVSRSGKKYNLAIDIMIFVTYNV